MLGQPDVEIYTLTENVAVVDRIVNLVNKLASPMPMPMPIPATAT